MIPHGEASGHGDVWHQHTNYTRMRLLTIVQDIVQTLAVPGPPVPLERHCHARRTPRVHDRPLLLCPSLDRLGSLLVRFGLLQTLVDLWHGLSAEGPVQMPSNVPCDGGVAVRVLLRAELGAGGRGRRERRDDLGNVLFGWVGQLGDFVHDVRDGLGGDVMRSQAKLTASQPQRMDNGILRRTMPLGQRPPAQSMRAKHR